MVQAANVLVGGGTGFVGRHLVNLLVKGGAKVRVVTRKPSKAPDQISWTQIKEEGLPKDTTAVVNVAGRNILDPVRWTEAFKKEVYDSRIETNKTLVNAIHLALVKPKSFVTISGVGYYPPGSEQEFDENWTQPENIKTNNDYLMDLARDWENSSQLNEHQAPTTRRVIIRSGVVIGNDGGVIKNLMIPFQLGLGGPIANGSQWFPWIHATDLANLFKFAITNEHVTGVINGVAPVQAKNMDFTMALGKALRRPYFLPTPAFVINLIFGYERGAILLKGQRVKSRASLLGFRYEYPNLDLACAESVKG